MCIQPHHESLCHHTVSQRAQAALQAVNALHGGGMGSMAIPTDAASIAGAAAQSPVLRVIVENLFYPVTLDVLHQVHPCVPSKNVHNHSWLAGFDYFLSVVGKWTFLTCCLPSRFSPSLGLCWRSLPSQRTTSSRLSFSMLTAWQPSTPNW